MPQAIVNLGDYENRVLGMVKGQFGLKNKSDAVNFLITKYAIDHYKADLRPEFVEETLRREREDKKIFYRNLEAAKRDIENTAALLRGEGQKRNSKNKK